MTFNYSKLKGKIIELYGSQANFCKYLGLSQRSLSLKMNNKTFFSQDEITKCVTLLKIKHKDIPTYFFTEIVQLD